MLKVDYAPISEIDFSTSRKKFKKLSSSLLSTGTVDGAGKSKALSLAVPEPTDDELKQLYQSLLKICKSVILSIVPPHSEMFVPSCHSDCFPKTLTSLYSEDLLHVPYSELINR